MDVLKKGDRIRIRVIGELFPAEFIYTGTVTRVITKRNQYIVQIEQSYGSYHYLIDPCDIVEIIEGGADEASNV